MKSKILKLGLDFGTTTTAVVLAQENNYHVIQHRYYNSNQNIELSEPILPSIISFNKKNLYYWMEAEEIAKSNESCFTLPSIKRILGDYYEGQKIKFEDIEYDIRNILTNMFKKLHNSITNSLGMEDVEFEVMTTVPANSNGAQRWLTRQALLDAGFSKVDLFDEPSSAAVEYAWRRIRLSEKGLPQYVIVYDLGGGTFDLSLVKIQNINYEVISSLGINKLGGDDFDEELQKLIIEKLDIDYETLSRIQKYNLKREAKRLKETISGFRSLPQKIPIDLSPLGIKGKKGAAGYISIQKYEEKITPYLEKTIETLKLLLSEDVIKKDGIDKKISYIYLVGGSTLLPWVTQIIHKHFPDYTIIKSPTPYESVAIGAAIRNIEKDNFPFLDRLSRNFGVIRVGQDHQTEYMDIIFPRGTKLPSSGQQINKRIGPYRPYYNIGWLKYLETQTLNTQKLPAGNVKWWEEVLFPYSTDYKDAIPSSPPLIQFREDLNNISIIEDYTLDSNGIVVVKITRLPDNYVKTYQVVG